MAPAAAAGVVVLYVRYGRRSGALHLRCRGLPGSLVLAGRILALGLVLGGRILALALLSSRLRALLSRRLRSAGLALPSARCCLLLSARALRGSPATRGQSPGRSAAVTGEAAGPAPPGRRSTAGESAASLSPSASTTPSLRIHLANEPQNEKAHNEPRPDTTP